MEFKRIKPYPGMVITENVEFEKGEYDFFCRDGIVIGADNIIINGNGACLRGGHEKLGSNVQGNTQEFGYENLKSPDNAKELGFYGTGIYAENRKGVIIKDLKVAGFDLGLHAKNDSDFVIDSCDFSDCFTDPAWGWDDHGLHGGILLENTHRCQIISCKASNVWDAVHMRFSNDNKVLNGNFSHTSNTGLRMWNSCRNEFCDNDFSYGLRIDPGEVHARDSSSVLIESGSNDNIFKRNDMSHGGDGLFIRVLNGWMSTGNYFEENDCSYANNNAIEAWADGNIYVRNKVNYSSYGFWLGGSDNTILDGNEVAFNGGIFNNAPESFGNAGVACVNGSGSHIVMVNNHIHDNHGPGVAIRFNKDYPCYHWVIQNNIIERNKTHGSYKGHGIYAKNAKWLTFSGNRIEDNDGEPVFFDGNTSDMVFLQGNGQKEEVHASFTMNPEVIHAGKAVAFDASECMGGQDGIRCRWDLGDETAINGPSVTHTYEKAGFYRMGLTVDNGGKAALAYKNIYVLPEGQYFGADAQAGLWSITGNAEAYELVRDPMDSVAGQGSVSVKAGMGNEHLLTYPASGQLGLQLGDHRVFNAYIKYHADAEPDWNRSIRLPVITFYADDSNFIEFKPVKEMMERLFAVNNEEKNNWLLISIDLEKGGDFEGCTTGKGLKDGIVNKISIRYGNHHPGVSQLWLDALCFSKRQPKSFKGLDIALNRYGSEYPKPLFSSNTGHSDPYAPLSGEVRLFGDGTPRFAATPSEDACYGVDFGCVREFDRLDVSFYHNLTDTLNAHSEAVPVKVWLEAEEAGEWRKIDGTLLKPVKGPNVFVFKPVLASKVRVRFECDQNRIASIHTFSVYNTGNAITPLKEGLNVEITSNRKNPVVIDSFDVKLNKEINGKGMPLGDLVARVFELDGEGRLTRCLFTSTVPKEHIIPYKVTKIEAGLTGLESGRKYALALGQTSLAESRTVGDYYRWIAGKTDFKETFGIYDNGETKPSDYDWGTANLRINCGGITQDYFNESEHVGTRFGIAGMECRYMTFTVPDPLNALTDGIASGQAAWIAEGDDARIHFSFAEEVSLCGINLWLDGDQPDRIEVLGGDKILAALEKPEAGLVRLGFPCLSEKVWTLRFQCAKGSCRVREIELDKCR